MDGNKDFFSEEEISEFRRELEELAISDTGRNLTGEKEALEAFPEGQLLQELVDEANFTPLTIDENGSYVKISDDDMCAWLYLMPPGTGKENYTMEELTDFLKKNGVLAGYHHSNLAAMIKKRVYEREIVVARGQAAIEGNDGYFEYKFDPEQYKAPRVLANGRVDYTNMSTLQNVHKGDVVAVYHHAKIGQDGYDIKGRPLQAKNVKDIPPLKGQSVYTEENPDIYLAQRDGKIELKNDRIDIQNVHEINGDVTLIVGKIEFFGDIIINGNVEAGVVIRAGRNIEIKGTVEAVNLFAGGDIILSRGIQGAQRAKISARGNIYADFIEHTVVMAGGNVQANTILNSRISADGNVLLTGKKGAIIGGYTHAMLGISATEIGNEVEVRTVVHAGCEKETYLKHQDAKMEENALLGEIKELSEQVAEIVHKRKVTGFLHSDVLEKKSKDLEEHLMKLKGELNEIRQDLLTTEELIAKGQGAQIEVNGNIYRGTVIGLSQAQMPVEHSTCFMKYYQLRGIIESSVMAYT